MITIYLLCIPLVPLLVVLIYALVTESKKPEEKSA